MDLPHDWKCPHRWFVRARIPLVSMCVVSGRSGQRLGGDKQFREKMTTEARHGFSAWAWGQIQLSAQGHAMGQLMVALCRYVRQQATTAPASSSRRSDLPEACTLRRRPRRLFQAGWPQRNRLRRRRLGHKSKRLACSHSRRPNWKSHARARQATIWAPLSFGARLATMWLAMSE